MMSKLVNTLKDLDIFMESIMLGNNAISNKTTDNPLQITHHI